MLIVFFTLRYAKDRSFSIIARKNSRQVFSRRSSSIQYLRFNEKLKRYENEEEFLLFFEKLMQILLESLLTGSDYVKRSQMLKKSVIS